MCPYPLTQPYRISDCSGEPLRMNTRDRIDEYVESTEYSVLESRESQ